MSASSTEGYGLIWGSLLLALVLQVMPMPESWLLWRPCWLGMALVYWCLVLPSRVGVTHGFVFGLLLDLLDGTVLGEHALMMSLLAFLALLLYQRMRFYSLWQQAPMVMIITGLILLLEQWVRMVIGSSTLHLQFILPALLSGLLWPWFFTLMMTLQRRQGL